MWCFPIPLPDDWLSNEDIRSQIDKACKGVNSVPDFVNTHIRESIASMKSL